MLIINIKEDDYDNNNIIAAYTKNNGIKHYICITCVLLEKQVNFRKMEFEFGFMQLYVFGKKIKSFIEGVNKIDMFIV